MVKINDPRVDRAGVTMRLMRADKVISKIKKRIIKYKSFSGDKLELEKIDEYFYEDFNNSPGYIQEELIFLWEELGDMRDELDYARKKLHEYEEYYQNQNEHEHECNEHEYDNIKLNLDNSSINIPPPPIESPPSESSPESKYITNKRKYVMAP